jgi:3-dehydroquinate synthase
MASPASSVRVELGSRSYLVDIGESLTETVGTRMRSVLGPIPGRAMIVVDANIPMASVDPAIESLRSSGFSTRTINIHSSEANKSLATVESVLVALARGRHERGDPVIALGGGVIGDLAGFAAAIHRRGVPFVQCPSTLLSMVDASVGGKTGVNIGVDGSLQKNMIGAFWQPRLVLADVSLLRSLPARELRAGLAECVKHGLISRAWDDRTLFDETNALVARALALDPASLVALVSRNVALKARVVAGDEREESGDPSSGRAHLNLGHTFAHAIETLPGLRLDTGPASPILHGEAVSLGLVAASRCAADAGLCDRDVVVAIVGALRACGLPIACAGLPENPAIIDAMMRDKKVSGGRLRLVLPTSLGVARVFDDVATRHVEAGLNAIRA